jgi:opacity protein-like surface antigen
MEGVMKVFNDRFKVCFFKYYAISLVYCCLSILVLLSPAAVSESHALQAGSKEVSFFGMISSTKADVAGAKADTTVRARVGFNHYLTDSIAIGLDTDLSVRKAGAAPNQSTLSYDGKASYNFNTADRLVPYVALSIGFELTGSDGVSTNGFSYGALAGLKFFVADNVSLNGELNYKIAKQTGDGFSFGTSTVGGLVGMSYYFGK